MEDIYLDVATMGFLYPFGNIVTESDNLVLESFGWLSAERNAKLCFLLFGA